MANEKKRIKVYIIILILICLLIYIYEKLNHINTLKVCQNAISQINQLNKKIIKLNQRNHYLLKDYYRLSNEKRQILDSEIPKKIGSLYREILDRIVERDPEVVAKVKSFLRQNYWEILNPGRGHNLAPFRFENIYVLKHLIIARISDGHALGSIILSYGFSRSGKIRYKVLDTIL